MKKVIILLLALVTAIMSYSQKDKRFKGIEKELNEILKVTKAPGFAVAVVEKDKVIYSKGFGYSDYENKIPVDANTLFAIGSCTKAFTSSILGQLRQKNKISFDDSPIKYIPEMRFYNNELNSNVIIEDLMCHRTGIPRHDFSWYLFPTDSKDSLIQRIKYLEPFTGLRQKWYYNNFMYLVLGVVSERITGKSWEDNIRERFFAPLGMERSNVSLAELEKSSNAALGYILKDDSIIEKTDYYNIAAMSPAGSINSSVNDMSKWLMTWINNGKFNNIEILPEPYVNEAISSHAVVKASFPEKELPDLFFSNYGYGWGMSSYKGHYRVMHGGAIDGFSASVAFFPSDSIGIVVLTNQEYSSVPYMVRNMVAERMLDVKKTDWIEYFLTNKKKLKHAKVTPDYATTMPPSPSHDLNAYTGSYTYPGYGTFKITKSSDTLFANFKSKKIYLKHLHYDIFEPFIITETGIDTTTLLRLQFNFKTNNDGEIASVNINLEPTLDHPIEFEHEQGEYEIDLITLKKYTGEFDFAGTPIKFYIKNENTLYTFVSGQPEYELIPIGKDLFAIKILAGYKLEFVESEGAFNEVIFKQPNGIYKATRIK